MPTHAKSHRNATPDRKKRTILVALLLILLTATVSWAMWSREDPQMAKVRSMAEEMEDMSWDQRRDHYRQMREETEKLTDEQREQFRDEMRGRWEEREAKRMKEFFDLTPEEQIAELDRQIDRMEEWRKRREANGDRGRERRGRGDRGRGGRPRTQSYGRSADGSNANVDRRNSRLDRRSPDSRARRSEYFRMMTARMRDRGVSFPRRGPRS